MTENHPKRRLTLADSIAIISATAMIAWIISDFFGGMIMWLLVYGYIVIPLVIIYLISVFSTIILISRTGVRNHRIKTFAHAVAMIVASVFVLGQSELLRSKRVLSATLKDDMFHYNLVFRENGNVENIVYGSIGLKETYKGTYEFKGDTIVFLKKPYDNNFIPDTLLIDREQKAIFIGRDESGNFIRKKEHLNYFGME